MRMEELIKKIAEFEGFRELPYICAGGVKTIGYGFTDKDIVSRDYISREEADRILTDKVVKLCAQVHVRMNYLGYDTLSNNQYYALTSFTYNLGLGALNQLTDNGKRDINTIAEKMLLYVKANGQTLQGLVKRRTWEKLLFLAPDGEIPTNHFIDNDIAKRQRLINEIINKLDKYNCNEVNLKLIDVDGLSGRKTNEAIDVLLQALLEILTSLGYV